MPRHRILAVDDTEDTLELIRLSLQDRYDVLTLSNPVDVYEYVELFEPDLLILDVMMPRVTGFQLLEMLQGNLRSRELPIIILSAKNATQDVKHGYRLGASLYLTKPFPPERLLKNVHLQFEVHPPSGRTKALGLGQVVEELEKRPGYQQGEVQIATSQPPNPA